MDGDLLLRHRAVDFKQGEELVEVSGRGVDAQDQTAVTARQHLEPGGDVGHWGTIRRTLTN